MQHSRVAQKGCHLISMSEHFSNMQHSSSDRSKIERKKKRCAFFPVDERKETPLNPHWGRGGYSTLLFKFFSWLFESKEKLTNPQSLFLACERRLTHCLGNRDPWPVNCELYSRKCPTHPPSWERRGEYYNITTINYIKVTFYSH